MKIWKSFYSFDHPWDVVARAACRKYPNPLNTAVLGTDVIDRKVIDGVLYSHKLVTSMWRFPGWAKALLGQTQLCYGSEKSEVDPNAKQMIVRTKNLTFYRFIMVRETLKYVPDPEDSAKTLLVQEAVVSVRGVPLTGYMEELLTSNISYNAMKGREAIEWVIQRMDSDLKQVANAASNSADVLLQQTKQQIQDFTTMTKRTMDDLQHSAFKSLDGIQNLTGPQATSQ